MKDSHLKILKETERISITKKKQKKKQIPARNTTPVCKNIAYLKFIESNSSETSRIDMV